MTKYLKIAILVLVLFVIYAPSCVDEQAEAMREEAIITEARNDIRTVFETEVLSESSLSAFESTAEQKLADFVDYLHILVDTSLDISFRVNAGEMIKNTFLSDKVNLQLALQKDDTNEELNVYDLIKNGLENKLSPSNYSINLIVVREPFQRTEKTIYAGSLKFTQIFNNPSQTGKSPETLERIADIYLIKEHKLFGTDTLNIWSVKLGDIR